MYRGEKVKRLHTHWETILLYLSLLCLFCVDISTPSVNLPVRHRGAMLKTSPMRPCTNWEPHIRPLIAIQRIPTDTQSTGWRHNVLPRSTHSVPLKLFHFPWQISPWAIHQRHKPILKVLDDFVTTAATLLCHAAPFCPPISQSTIFTSLHSLYAL